MTSTPPRLYIVRLRTLLDVHSPLLLYDVQVPTLHKICQKLTCPLKHGSRHSRSFRLVITKKAMYLCLMAYDLLRNLLASQPATLSCVMFILLNLRRFYWLVSVTLEEKRRCSRFGIGNGEKHQPHTLKQTGYL